MKTINYESYLKLKSFNYDLTTDNKMTSKKVVEYLRLFDVRKQKEII